MQEFFLISSQDLNTPWDKKFIKVIEPLKNILRKKRLKFEVNQRCLKRYSHTYKHNHYIFIVSHGTLLSEDNFMKEILP